MVVGVPVACVISERHRFEAIGSTHHIYELLNFDHWKSPRLRPKSTGAMTGTVCVSDASDPKGAFEEANGLRRSVSRSLGVEMTVAIEIKSRI